MRLICIAAMAWCCCACHRHIVVPSSTAQPQTHTAPDNNAKLLGTHTKADLQQAPYASWFNKNYADYNLDSSTADQLKAFVKDKQFEIFMGTWCGDSKREVPRMFKLLDYAGVQPSQIKMVMVDNRDSDYKQSPAHEEKGKGIHRVPDLIVYSHGTEINRIIESPVLSLEKDLLHIVNGSAYQPHYRGAAYLAKLVISSNTAALLSDTTRLATIMQPMLQQSAELNTLGYVWMAAGETDKAMLAFQLNTILFPAEANVFDSMGELYLKLNQQEMAKKYYRQVLVLEPGRASAVKILAGLNPETTTPRD